MPPEFTIRPIRAEEAAQAKALIYRVAHPLMEPDMALEDLINLWEGWGVFADLDDVQKSYFANDGVFLVTEVGGQMVGTGGFYRCAEDMCEIKRITLLPEYRRQRLGYAMLVELIRRARELGYARLTLWTDRFKLARAVDFYHQLGFVDVPHEGAEDYEIWMELDILGA